MKTHASVPQPTADAAAAGSPSAAPPALMGRTAGHGMLWTLGSNGLTKLLVILSQLVMAWVLSSRDFGVYAIAIGVSMFVQTFRDGGVRELLVQKCGQYRELVGSTFWFAMTVNVVVGIGLGLAGEVVGRVYTATGYLHNPQELTSLVWVMAASLPISTPTAVLTARLRIDLRFSALAWSITLSSIVRYGGQIALALTGWGVMSLVMPVLAVAMFESIIAWALTRESPWMRPAETWRWKGIFQETKWLVFGQAAAGILNNGYYLVAGLFLPAEIVGVYYFAVQLLMQIETLIGQSVVLVLFPILSKLNSDPQRQGAAALRVARTTALVSAPMTIGLATIFPALEQVVFEHGKWAAAAAPLAILAIFYPLRTLFVAVPGPILQAQGRFRHWFLLWGWSCAGLLVVATIGSYAAQLAGPPPRVSILAWCVGCFLGVNCLWSTIRVLRPLGVSPARTISACLQTLPIALAVGLLCWWLDRTLITDWASRTFASSVHIRGHAVPMAPLAVVLVDGAIFSALYCLLARVLLQAHLREALSILPGGVGPRIAKGLRLA